MNKVASISEASSHSASQHSIKVGDTVIFRCSPYGDGDIGEFDGSVQSLSDMGINVSYLQGYKSMNDTIPFRDVIAKVDLSQPHIELKNAPYSGNFVEFGVNNE